MAKKSYLGSFLGKVAKAIDKAIKDSSRERKKEIDRLPLKADKIPNKVSTQSIHSSTNNLYRPVASGNNIIYASNIPKTVDIGNLIFEKRYEEAIKMGKDLLASCTDYSYEKMIHINLMQAYFSIRLEKPEYFDSSTYHAKQAIICGHNTGLAQERLIINLEKTGKINQAIQLCEIIISPKFQFSKNGYGTKDNFKIRHSKLLKKISKAADNHDDRLFTDYEKELIIERSKLNWY